MNRNCIPLVLGISIVSLHMLPIHAVRGEEKHSAPETRLTQPLKKPAADPAISRFLQAQRELNEFIRKRLSDTPDFAKIQQRSVELNAQAQRALEAHPALKDLADERARILAALGQANEINDRIGVSTAEVKLAANSTSLNKLATTIPEIAGQLKEARDARSNYKIARDKLLASSREGRQLVENVERARAAIKHPSK